MARLMRRRVALAAIVAATALVRWRLLAVPLERDEGEYAYMGQAILHGGVPYLVAHNMKLPGAYYVYAAVMAAFGQTTTAVHLGLLLGDAAAIVLVAVLGWRLLDVTTGLVAAAAYATLALGSAVLGQAAQAEHFLVVALLAGMVVLAGDPPTRARALLAGGAFGVAVLMKQHAIAFLPLGAAWAAARARDAGPARMATRAALFAAGAALPYAALCAGLAAAGAFPAFWFWTVEYARRYATLVAPADALRLLREALVRLVGGAPLLWLLAAVGLTALAWDPRARRRAPLLGGLVVASAAAVCPGLRFAPHYFVMALPAASLLVGVAVAAVAARVPRARALVGVALPAAAIAATLAGDRAYLLAPAPADVARLLYRRNPFPEAEAIGAWIAAHSAPDDAIGVVGSEPEIYFHARRPAATRYLHTYPLMEPQPFAAQMQDEMIRQLATARPRFLVLVNVDTSWTRRPDSSTRLLDWAADTVNRDYVAVGEVDLFPDRPGVFRWNADGLDATPRSPAYVVVFRRRD
jgi:hypothetical protein